MDRKNGFHRIHGEIFFEDYESEIRIRLQSLNVEITFNPCTYPFFDIEFYDNNGKVMSFLHELERERRIKIIRHLPAKTPNIYRKRIIKRIREAEKPRKKVEPNLTLLGKILKQLGLF